MWDEIEKMLGKEESTGLVLERKEVRHFAVRDI